MHSIRLKITAILVAAVLVAGLSVFLVGSFTIQAETDRESVKTMNLVAHDTQLSLETYTGSIEQSVELIGNLAGDTLQIDVSLGLDFASQNYLSCCHECFASHLRIGVEGKQLIQHGIADLVSHLVGMTFGNRF